MICKQDIVRYFDAKGVENVGQGETIDTFKQDLTVKDVYTNEIKKVFPVGTVLPVDVLWLEKLGLLKRVQNSLVKKYVKKYFAEVLPYKGKYGKGFTVDSHNKDSHNYAKRNYYVWNKETIPPDGFVILLNSEPQGMEGREILANVFKRFDQGNLFLEAQIGEDILQIYCVKNF